MSINSDLKRLLLLLEKQSVKNISSYERQVILQYRNALVEIKKTYALWLERGYGIANLQQLEGNINQILKSVGIEVNNITANGIKKNFTINYNGVQDAFKTVLNTSEAFSVLNTQTVNAAVINPYSRINWQAKNITNITNATDVLRTEITQGIIQGKNYQTVAKAITHELNIKASDALRIVRTETHRATNQARLLSVEDSKDAAERLGFTPQQIWNTTNINSRETHLNLDGVAADANGDWDLGGITTKGPGLSGDAGEDINCNCFVTIELAEI